MRITREELIEKYITFFKSRGHKEIKNSSLIPENDPTVLFTTAGMHPLVPYLLGEKHPQGKRLVNVQRCIRTGDIEEVGDSCHHTFFEMMGNWSLGDYFKKEAIEWSYEFATKILNLNKERLAVTVFAGSKDSPKDDESEKIWLNMGVPEEKIAFLESNWWQHPSNNTPCGPCTEMFFWKLNNVPVPKVFNPEDNNWVEIWNDVLMGFTKISEREYIIAKQKNIDNGRGLERVLAVLNGFDDNYLTEVWQPLIKKIEELSSKNYKGNEKTIRIIADHIKASVFILADGVLPSNSERGYVLRKLVRRAIVRGRKLNLNNFVSSVAESVFEIYGDYEHLQKNKKLILEELSKEENKFLETLEKGMKHAIKMAEKDTTISGKDSFLLFQSYGIPPEVIDEIVEGIGSSVDREGFEKELAKHQELSRTASAGVFKSGLADDSEATTRLHTATHLLNQALRIVLKNPNIHQRGSNITSERARFDFAFDRKLTSEEIKKVEDLVNETIQKNLDVVCEEISIEEARKKGAQGVFDSKYGEKVKVYSIGDFSIEICAGPHVKNTSELGTFKILKEEASSAGVRRIKAILID